MPGPDERVVSALRRRFTTPHVGRDQTLITSCSWAAAALLRGAGARIAPVEGLALCCPPRPPRPPRTRQPARARRAAFLSARALMPSCCVYPCSVTTDRLPATATAATTLAAASRPMEATGLRCPRGVCRRSRCNNGDGLPRGPHASPPDPDEGTGVRSSRRAHVMSQ